MCALFLSKWIVGLICDYSVILRFLYILKPTPFLLIINCESCKSSIVNVYAITEQSERPSITEAPIGLQTSRKCFGPLLHIEFHQNMVASNMHFYASYVNVFD